MSVWVSSGAFEARDIDALLVEAAARGISAVELSSGFPDSDGLLAALEGGAAVGMRYLVHNYFPAPRESFVLNIASPDRDNRERSIAFAKRAVELCERLRVPFYSLHAGYAVPLAPEDLGRPGRQAELVRGRAIDRDAALDSMKSAMEELSDHAARHGVRLLLENNVVSPRQVGDGRPQPLLMAEPKEAVSFLSALGRDNVGLLLDVAHARVAGAALGFDPLRFFDDCAEWIGALHLSDNDGIVDNNRPFAEDSWFFGRLKEFAELPFVVEVYRMDAGTMRSQIALAGKAKGR
jgi:sugar phosphate isomerase/epimerase